MKPTFELLRIVSLIHLTFKAVFLLALESWKHRSEIHAWLNKNIRQQSDWSKVLCSSPIFLSKNHLVKEVPECVAPLIIPALVPALDKSLKDDRKERKGGSRPVRIGLPSFLVVFRTRHFCLLFGKSFFVVPCKLPSIH